VRGAFLILLFYASSAVGQIGPASVLWRVRSAAGVDSYVIGTVHSRDARAFVHVPLALAALAHTELLAGEIDLNTAEGQVQAMRTSMMLPAGTDPEDLYSKRRYRKVQQTLAERLGAMAPLLARMKPFFLMSMLAESGMRTDSTRMLDQYLQEKAAGMGLSVVGLESVAEQLAAMNGIPLQEQADMLYEAVTSDDQEQQMERMMEKYVLADLAAIGEITGKMGSSAFSTMLLDARNRTMAHRMDSLMQEGRACFFAIGTAHLAGTNGVLERPRGRGYEVQAVLRREDIPSTAGGR
jgi:uncharacterized protein